MPLAHAFAAVRGPLMSRSSPAEVEVESVWIEPIMFRPPTLFAGAPLPPWLRQPMPPRPYGGAVWIAGHWTWQRRWLWAYGLWTSSPGPDWRWVDADYRPDEGGVWFTPAHWAHQVDGLPGARSSAADYDAAGPIAGGPRRARAGSDWAPFPRSQLPLRYLPPRHA